MGLFSVFSRGKYTPSQTQVVRRGFGFRGTGTRVDANTAMTASAFNRGVVYLSSQIAKLPWKVKDKDKNTLSNDRITKILDLCPNDEMSSMSFRLFMVQAAALHGNAYAEIERDMLGRPVALWPMLPGHCEPFRNKDHNLRYRILGGAIDGSGNNVILRTRDVFHVKNLHTSDGIVGLSIVDYAREILGITVGADVFANSLYSNGALPAGIITAPGAMSDDAFARVKDTWDSSHGGRKVGGTAILEEGMKYEPLALTPDTLQFIDTRKFNVIEIARFLGVPPQKLYSEESAKFKNVEQANIQVANDTIDPWVKSFELEADIKLLNKRFDGRNTQFDLYDLFRGDMATRSAYYKDMFSLASITPNQIREKEGEAPYKEGDRYFVATNNFTPADRLDEVLDSQTKTPEPPKETETDNAIVNYLKKK